MQCKIDEKKLTVKLVKVLRYFEDANIFSLEVKKMIATAMIEEIKAELQQPERGL